MDSILWKGHEPTYEEYSATVTKIETMQNEITDLNDYRINVLGTARDRMEDEDNPLEKDELEELRKNITDSTPSFLKDSKQENEVSLLRENSLKTSFVPRIPI